LGTLFSSESEAQEDVRGKKEFLFRTMRWQQAFGNKFDSIREFIYPVFVFLPAQLTSGMSGETYRSSNTGKCWQFPSLTSFHRLHFIDPLLYMMALEGHFEITVSLNMHGVNLFYNNSLIE
jgi:hypothetical protein